MVQPIPGDTRAAVLADIDAGMARNAIARKHGVAPSTVTKIAKDNGRDRAFDRSAIASAHVARVADQRSRRSERLAALGDVADEALTRAREAYKVVMNSADGPTTVTLERPPLREVEAAARTMATWLDKQIMVERHEAGSNENEAAKSTLSTIMALARGVADADRPSGGAPDHGADSLAVAG